MSSLLIQLKTVLARYSISLEAAAGLSGFRVLMIRGGSPASRLAARKYIAKNRALVPEIFAEAGVKMRDESGNIEGGHEAVVWGSCLMPLDSFDIEARDFWTERICIMDIPFHEAWNTCVPENERKVFWTPWYSLHPELVLERVQAKHPDFRLWQDMRGGWWPFPGTVAQDEIYAQVSQWYSLCDADGWGRSWRGNTPAERWGLRSSEGV